MSLRTVSQDVAKHSNCGMHSALKPGLKLCPPCPLLISCYEKSVNDDSLASAKVTPVKYGSDTAEKVTPVNTTRVR